MVDKLDAWHKKKLGLLVFTVLELVIAYLFVSLAIDKGNFLYYLLTLAFLFGSLQNFFKLIGKLAHEKK
jgi:hypothetical protein